MNLNSCNLEIQDEVKLSICYNIRRFGPNDVSFPVSFFYLEVVV